MKETQKNKRWLVVALLIVIPSLIAASDVDTLWRTYMAAGEKAFDQGRYTEAEENFQAALKEVEKFGPQDRPLAHAASIHHLGLVYKAQGKYAQAEPLLERALAIVEKAFGSDDPRVGTSLYNLAELYRAQGKYAQAEPLYQRALMMEEKARGPGHPNVAAGLNALGQLYYAQGDYPRAERLFKRALTTWEKALGSEHPFVATGLNELGLLYGAQGKYAEAEPLFKRALTIYEKALGPEHPNVANALQNYAALLKKMDRNAEAEKLNARADAIQAERMREVRRPTLTPVTNVAERLEFKGFSVLPPRGDKWFIGAPPTVPDPSSTAVLFFKLVSTLHSIYAGVKTYVPAVTFKSRTEGLQYLASYVLEEWKSNPRFKPLDVEASLDKCLGYDCVRYKVAVEDHGPRDFPGSVMILIRQGFIIPHPQSPTFYLWLEYSQRFPQGQTPFPIEAELGPFLTSLKFTPRQ